MQFSQEVKETLWSLIDEMTVNLSDFTVHPGKDFTQEKKWDFPTLIKFIISMESQSLKNELHKYFGYTTDCPTKCGASMLVLEVCHKKPHYLNDKIQSPFSFSLHQLVQFEPKPKNFINNVMTKYPVALFSSIFNFQPIIHYFFDLGNFLVLIKKVIL